MALLEPYQTINTYDGETAKVGGLILYNQDGYLLPGRIDEVDTDPINNPYPYGVIGFTVSLGFTDPNTNLAATAFIGGQTQYDDDCDPADPTTLASGKWMHDPA